MTGLYDLGPFRLDAKVGALTRAGMPAVLGARAVAVLTVLVEHAHQFVSKSGLIDAAWPDVIVEESNLAVQIHAIRRVLSEVPGGEHWVETLAKRGYRFVGPVTALPDSGGRDGTRSNLPEPVTSFVGRERDLVEIKRLLPTKRLVTLVGVGGIGKTRLALQIAGEVIAAYRDGVWFVELGSLRDPALVPTSLAQVLGVPERAGKPLTDALCAHLRKLQVLLILDNCEHLLGAVAQLVDALLSKAADTTILTTSREPLRTAGEQVYPLQPLSLPESEASVETMARSDAVQLMVDRVRRQLPDFELTSARAPAVAELCIHLDGIPLALELAAARTRSLSVEQINARLGDRFHLLTGGARTALPRQQTLRATLDWSYDLLSEDERVVLRRLAVFPGSFTVEAASAVASDARIDDFAVIDLLSQLVARSLVIADTSALRARHRLLETTRAYALEKLTEAGETDAIARRHAAHFRNVFERAPYDWQRMSDSELRATYFPELDDVRAALA
jgi:predicted ATPase/DNA-binding winged helix-turn-helix (wHTH) protein